MGFSFSEGGLSSNFFVVTKVIGSFSFVRDLFGYNVVFTLVEDFSCECFCR